MNKHLALGFWVLLLGLVVIPAHASTTGEFPEESFSLDRVDYVENSSEAAGEESGLIRLEDIEVSRASDGQCKVSGRIINDSPNDLDRVSFAVLLFNGRGRTVSAFECVPTDIQEDGEKTSVALPPLSWKHFDIAAGYWPANAKNIEIRFREAHRLGAPAKPAESVSGNEESASQKLNLLLKGGFYIPGVTVLSEKEGILWFAYGRDGRVYRLQKEFFESLSDRAPADCIPVPPLAVRQYLVKGSSRTGEGSRRMLQSSFGGAFFLYGNLGYSGYTMAMINDIIKGNNGVFRYYNLPQQPALAGGMNYSGGLGIWINDNLAFGLELAYLEANSSGGGDLMGEKLNIPALEIVPFLKLGVPLGREISFTSTLGMDFLSLSGASLYDHIYAYGSRYLSLTGSTIGIKAAVGLEYAPEANFGIGMDIGYRSATITEVTGRYHDGSSGVLLYSYTPLSIDYSGFYFQTGIRIYFK